MNWHWVGALIEAIWSGRGDSNPRLELGKLPYYPYTTAAQTLGFVFYSTPLGNRQAQHTNTLPPLRVRLLWRAGPGAVYKLANLNDAGCLHDGRFFLPLGKAGGFSAVGIDASKSLAIAVKHRHLPVPMLAPLVLTEDRVFLAVFQSTVLSGAPRNISRLAAATQVEIVGIGSLGNRRAPGVPRSQYSFDSGASQLSRRTSTKPLP